MKKICELKWIAISILIIMTTFFIIACTSQKEEIQREKICQLSCLNGNMSYKLYNIIEKNASETQIQCVCNSYQTITKT